MTLDRICQTQVDVAQPHDSVQFAAERMRQRTVGCLIVVDEQRMPVGMVTDRDLVIRVLADGKNPFTTEIGDVMSTRLHTIRQDATLEEALALMRSGNCRRLPVVDCHGMLLGIVTLDDVLLLLAEEFTQAGRIIDRETPRAAAMAVW